MMLKKTFEGISSLRREKKVLPIKLFDDQLHFASMGNIVTPEQGFLPVPAAAAGAILPYPWWLTGALAIWALLALLCCWLALLLLLLRYCCRRWRHRRYAADAKSKGHRIFGSSKTSGDGNLYGGHGAHFASLPLPPLPVYGGRGAFEQEIVEDEIYGDGRSYVAAGVENRGLETSSESYSEEEISAGGGEAGKKSRQVVKRFRPIPVASDPSAKAVKENIETNVERNITKNYIINEERNYYIQNEPVLEPASPVHDPEIQRLPAPSVTTINMAAERLADDPSWEKTNAINANDGGNEKNNQRASSEIVTMDPSLLNQDVVYEKPPNIFTHRPPTPVKPREEEPKVVIEDSRKLPAYTRMEREDDHGSTTSEMSGHDSESIYETIRVLTPRKQSLAPLEDDDVYRTAGIDELEIEISDLVRLQKASNRVGGDAYQDILSSTNFARRRLTPRLSSASSSSTLNNLMPMINGPQNSLSRAPVNEEKQEETVTETVQTQQIQTTVRQIGQRIDDSAFFIPLPSSTMNQSSFAASQRQIGDGNVFMPLTSSTGQQNGHQQGNDGTIFIPVSSGNNFHPDEQAALRDQREQ